jgi:hypothetical protein
MYRYQAVAAPESLDTARLKEMRVELWRVSDLLTQAYLR